MVLLIHMILMMLILRLKKIYNIFITDSHNISVTSIQSCQKLALAWVFPPVSGAENIVYSHLF